MNNLIYLLYLFLIFLGNILISKGIRCRRGRDRMVDGFTTTCAISAYRY